MAASRPFVEFEQVQIFQVHRYMKSHIFFHSNGLAIWHGFLNITHIQVNNGRKICRYLKK